MTSILAVEKLQIIQILTLDARASYATMAAVLGVSEQTAARRFQALIRDGVVRCRAWLDHRTLGQSQWILRVTPAGSGTKLAEALSLHPAMSWVSMTDTEVVCFYQPQSAADSDTMLADRIRTTSLVESMDARQILRRFPLRTSWPDLAWTLDVTQQTRLRELADSSFAVDRHGDTPTRSADVLSAEDKALIGLIVRDPRTPYSHLGRSTGMTRARIATRVGALTEAGILRFDIEVDPDRIGLRTSAVLWVEVALERLEAVGLALGRLSEIQFVCATTGTTGLFATISARDTVHLYELMTRDIAPIEGIRSVEVRTYLRTPRAQPLP